MVPVALEVEDSEPLLPARSLRGRVGFLLPVCLLWAADKLLAAGAALLHITFPSALLGMGAILSILVAAAGRRPPAVAAVEAWFRPGVDFIHCWLPLWYIPAVVTFPLAIAPLSGTTLGVAALLVLGGIPLVLWFTAGVAMLVRRTAQTEMETFPFHAAKLEVTRLHWYLWGALAAAALLVSAVAPGRPAQLAGWPLFLATAVLGYMLGMALPPRVQRWVHPILLCGALPSGAAALHGLLTGAGYLGTLDTLVRKGRGGYGPGDLLYSFLGVVILSFGFKVYEQWPVMRRHVLEILAATASSALFGLLSTAGMARLAGLPPDVARGLVPRSVTMALALPIAAQLGAPLPITAAAVALTGTAGSLALQPLLDVVRFRDPIARGLAAAAAAHGFGTAALSAKEPEALPFCALSYACCGVFASCWAALPPVRWLLLAITG